MSTEQAVEWLGGCVEAASLKLRHVTNNIPNAPAFDTAAASAGQLALQMGAWTMGRSMLRRRQSDV